MIKNELIKIGKNSRKALEAQLNTKKKDQVLKDFCKLIEKNKNLILLQNKKDVKIAYQKNLKII